jgi:hypothetical protein
MYYLLHLNILHSTLFLNSINLHSSLRVTDPLQHLFKIAYTIMVLSEVRLSPEHAKVLVSEMNTTLRK